MSLMEIIQRRYSCRSYLEKEIEQEKLDKILEAARLAPSAKNFQDWRFIVVTDKEIKTEIAALTNRPSIFEKAGAIIVACSNKETGKATRSMCKVGCIGCGLCAKQSDIFKVENNLARLDFTKYQPNEQTETAMNKCPTKVIIYRGKTAPEPPKSKQKATAIT